MAYFDNAATTFPKPEEVYSFMDSFYRNNGGNAGRGSYSIAKTAAGLISDTRTRLMNLLHCDAKQVIFCPSATIALNMILQGLLKQNVKNVYITPFEHNAVTRILHRYEQENGLKVEKLAVSNELQFDLERIRYQFASIKPDLVIMSHVSNVIGLITPVAEICSLAKEYNSTTVIDMAQSAGLVDLNVGLESIDFAVFAGHKTLYGPTGISGFIMKPGYNLPVVLMGGTGYDSANQNMPNSLPERYEMGTLNISGIAGLNAALSWIQETGIPALYDAEKKNRERLLDLFHQYDFLRIVGNHESSKCVGIVSCLIDGISSDSAGTIFFERGISVRTGLQCAPVAHQFLGTYPAGTIRFSTSYFTSDDDLAELREALDDIQSEL